MAKNLKDEITPKKLYLSRRKFIKGLSAVAAATLISGCGEKISSDKDRPKSPISGADSDENGDALTTFKEITNYNNFYEFSTDKEEVAELSRGFKVRPWTISIGGHINNPKTYGIDELLKKFKPVERIYRMRCVEGWSMVIPWLGFPLAKLLREVEPLSKAKYVRFTAILDPSRLPGQQDTIYDWPYVEGLGLDEAVNDLTLLSHGLYGKPLLPQCGAPLRLVVPWKYGFKSIKSIVKIDLVSKMPVSLWMKTAPGEYGFYANVNPDVPHPRWTQSTERRIGELRRRKTLPFNGYEKEVAHLYKNMNLKENF